MNCTECIELIVTVNCIKFCSFSAEDIYINSMKLYVHETKYEILQVFIYLVYETWTANKNYSIKIWNSLVIMRKNSHSHTICHSKDYLWDFIDWFQLRAFNLLGIILKWCSHHQMFGVCCMATASSMFSLRSFPMLSLVGYTHY